MFNMGFSEIFVIMVVALVVIGPAKLPTVARTMGQLWGRMQRYINQIKTEVSTSIELEELRQLQSKINAEADALERSVHQAGNDIKHDVRQLEKELDLSVQDAGKAILSVESHLLPKQP